MEGLVAGRKGVGTLRTPAVPHIEQARVAHGLVESREEEVFKPPPPGLR